MGMEIRVELDGELADHVAGVTNGDGWYASVEEYVRDLIRKDANGDPTTFEAYRAELQRAFDVPEQDYVAVSAAEVIERNRQRRAG